MESKEFYITEYNNFWEVCLEKGREYCKDASITDRDLLLELANEYFNENVNTNQLVGYYLKTFGEDAYLAFSDYINQLGTQLSDEERETNIILLNFVGEGKIKMPTKKESKAKNTI